MVSEGVGGQLGLCTVSVKSIEDSTNSRLAEAGGL